MCLLIYSFCELFLYKYILHETCSILYIALLFILLAIIFISIFFLQFVFLMLSEKHSAPYFASETLLLFCFGVEGLYSFACKA